MPVSRTVTSRRAALAATGAAAAAGLLSACSDDGAQGGGRSTRERERAQKARAEAALRLRTAAASAELRDRYEAVSLRHPGVRDRLAPLREEAAQHAAALAGTRPRPSPPGPPVPADPAEALGELAATARRISDGHLAALTAAPPELARLLASVAAAGAVHAYLLTRREGA